MCLSPMLCPCGAAVGAAFGSVSIVAWDVYIVKRFRRGFPKLVYIRAALSIDKVYKAVLY